MTPRKEIESRDRRSIAAAAASQGRRKPKNVWEPGETVTVGYMTLVVGRRIPTPGDGKPDQWELHSLDGLRDYRFAPYSGLKLVADRRPKAASPLKAPPALPAPKAAPPRMVRAISDQGKGRSVKAATAAATAADKAAEARLDRLERLVTSLVEGLSRRG